MSLQLSAKNLDLTNALRIYVNSKIVGLDRLNEHVTEMRVTLEKIRENHTDQFKATAQFHVSHEVLYTEEVAADMYAAIDIVKSEMERQLRDYKNKLETKHRKANAAVRDMKSAI